ncbi:hypothetical protein HanRHA438_Chr14g0645711 [Helianthus annuus]|nr:hypothetical protein HanHA300_Chr14g0517621 [Helianthus annuus]KAJ0485091.1 hypothetical protein HanHA89_Chr14g0564261 [Helianthus annuus]KAJ0655640.1 hypothetical protein HanLR1_Chr14g0526591 [Helianthus annuus]KAJ0659328.1 hypothetical protein HanOQP8_Chr14g0524841 [Helianthus annuus]KAJ0852961.1 hypothetical protein HanRHA438_Chr14g0645711 [Helianthus annuus]
MAITFDCLYLHISLTEGGSTRPKKHRKNNFPFSCHSKRPNGHRLAQPVL